MSFWTPALAPVAQDVVALSEQNANFVMVEQGGASAEAASYAETQKILSSLNAISLQALIGLHHNHNILLVVFRTTLVYHDYALNHPYQEE